MRGLQVNAPARAPGGTLPMWARATRIPRSLCGVDTCEKRSIGTASLPNSQLRSQEPETGRRRGSGTSRSGCPQSG